MNVFLTRPDTVSCVEVGDREGKDGFQSTIAMGMSASGYKPDPTRLSEHPSKSSSMALFSSPSSPARLDIETRPVPTLRPHSSSPLLLRTPWRGRGRSFMMRTGRSPECGIRISASRHFRRRAKSDRRRQKKGPLRIVRMEKASHSHSRVCSSFRTFPFFPPSLPEGRVDDVQRQAANILENTLHFCPSPFPPPPRAHKRQGSALHNPKGFPSPRRHTCLPPRRSQEREWSLKYPFLHSPFPLKTSLLE